MTPIPPDAKRVVLAAVVPCEKYDPGDCFRLRHYGACAGCLGDGTRTVVTDIEVESRGPHQDIGAAEQVWVEVQS